MVILLTGVLIIAGIIALGTLTVVCCYNATQDREMLMLFLGGAIKTVCFAGVMFLLYTWVQTCS